MAEHRRDDFRFPPENTDMTGDALKFEGGQLPVLFIGHGTPLNAIEDNVFTRAWAKLGAGLRRPRAILVISGHWYTAGTGVTSADWPETIYDFGYTNLGHIRYPVAGDPQLAERVAQLLAHTPVVRDPRRGLDHGAWSVLVKAFPAADIPVVQLSIDGRQPPRFHYEQGRKLAPLRDEGVLILASGNLVHNLPRTIRSGVAQPYPWAARFDAAVAAILEARSWERLIEYEALGPDAALSIPTPDHYLPLIYALGAADPQQPLSFPVTGIDRGSMSMRSVLFGDIGS